MGEKRRFLDRVLRFMGIEEEVAASDEMAVENEIAPTATHNLAERSPQARRRTRTVGLGAGQDGSRMRMIVLEPKRFDDVQAIADHLIDREPVVLRFEQLDSETARRIMDFLGGSTYALGGHIQRLGEHMFLLAPNNVEVDTQSLLSLETEGEKEHHS